MKSPALFTALLFLATTLGFAQEPQNSAYVETSGIRLQLGMSKAQVSTKLPRGAIEKFKVDTWQFSESGKPAGVLQFTSDRLSYVLRETHNSRNDIYDNLYGAIENLNIQGLGSCKIGATTSSDSQKVSKLILLECGNLSVAVGRDMSNGKPDNFVMETLGAFRKD